MAKADLLICWGRLAMPASVTLLIPLSTAWVEMVEKMDNGHVVIKRKIKRTKY